MTDTFTSSWADSAGSQLVGLDGGPGGSGVVEWVVTGGEPDRVWIRWVVDQGRVTQILVDDAAGDPDQVEVTVPLTRAQAEGVLAGKIDPAQAYMRGDLKPEGSSRAWFALLSALARPETQQVLRAPHRLT